MNWGNETAFLVPKEGGQRETLGLFEKTMESVAMADSERKLPLFVKQKTQNFPHFRVDRVRVFTAL